MKELIDLFWTKYSQIKKAVGDLDEQSIGILDREVESLLDSIFAREASNAVEIQMQFQLALELLKRESEDACCVLRHAENLHKVVERHIIPGHVGQFTPDDLDRSVAPERVAVDAVVAADLDVSLLESLSNRVSVVAPDYRFVFTNEANAVALHRKPEELLGRHVGEFIGLHRFVQGLKERLDRCFAGEIVDYTYADQMGGRTVVIRTRLSPYYASNSVLIGALLVTEELPDRRQSSAA
ncbi:PAS domain-containing protein [Gellertiella hungarica]|uniref:PAS domain-containing protein n=1 Tax=Gellertiella hungarica TaxID=1572859 RepID=A0A7W6NMH6_9HYPH|nr:PAS domain-containing protein [Gellertiella hungarica]MBB4066968.1 PAS domain-containing protein [Gellertiella hungarica]